MQTTTNAVRRAHIGFLGATSIAVGAALVACSDDGTSGDAGGDAQSSSLQADEFTLFADTSKPTRADDADSASVELGVRFTADQTGFIRGIRYYKSRRNGGTHVAHLWTNDGQLLKTATFTSETTSGWQTVRFDAPVAVQAGVSYVASYHADRGHYAGDNGYFANRSVDRGPLHANADRSGARNGVYRYGAAAFPTESYQSTNYWVDVIYKAATEDAGAPPAADSGTPPPVADAGTPPAADSGPAPTGRPGPTNTGVPAGTALTRTTGDLRITTAGTVIDGRDIVGCVDVQAPNVTIRRSRITCTGYYPLQVSSGSLVIEDTEIAASGGIATSCIAFTNYTARRVNCHGAADGFKADSDVLIEDSWVHDNWLGAGDHADGVQGTGGSNVTVRRNFIDIVDHGQGHGGDPNSCFQVGNEWGSNSNWTIDGNWLYGGGWIINFGTGGGTNNKITNNRFGDAGYGPISAPESGVTISGNVWDATGAPITSR
jgi:hypothetical protein